jgi:hypothetical protein
VFLFVPVLKGAHMARRTRQIGSFLATDDSGRQHTLNVFQDFTQAKDLDGNYAETLGLPYVFTKDAQRVNVLSKGEYVVRESGLRLRSTDPDAI